MIVYNGPSKLDGSPIVVIAIAGSANAKTGDMVQTYILRADMEPLEASRTGADSTICGDCPHRGVADGSHAKGRSCYVNIGQAPTAMYRKFARGGYPVGTDKDIARMVRGRVVRLGAYGDPAAVPTEILTKLVAGTRGHTGYTHAWRNAPEIRGLCMASCDTEQDRTEAKLAGWRTFRVRRATDTVGVREFECPASAEQGKRKQCWECLACCGTANDTRTRAADVTIVVHGGIAATANGNRKLTALTMGGVAV